MLLMWVLPSRVVSRIWRGRILYMVDQIGKYSLVDVFVILFINGSLFSLLPLSSQYDDLSEPVAYIAIRTRQEVGFFIFVAATVASLLIGHICLYYHEEHPLVKEDLYNHLVKGHTQSTILKARSALTIREAESAISDRSRRLIGPFLCVLLVFTVASFSAEAFNVKVFAAGVKINDSSYSMAEFAASMRKFNMAIRFGTVFSQMTLILFALSTIVLHLLLLLTIWYFKIKPSWWECLNTAAHTLAAWSSLDVMAISMAITLLEMEASDFVRPHANVKQMASKLFGVEAPTGKFLRIEVTLLFGTYMMLALAAAHAILGRIVMGIVERAVVIHGKKLTSDDEVLVTVTADNTGIQSLCDVDRMRVANVGNVQNC
jgi:hypothetical protein